MRCSNSCEILSGQQFVMVSGSGQLALCLEPSLLQTFPTKCTGIWSKPAPLIRGLMLTREIWFDGQVASWMLPDLFPPTLSRRSLVAAGRPPQKQINRSAVFQPHAVPQERVNYSLFPLAQRWLGIIIRAVIIHANCLFGKGERMRERSPSRLLCDQQIRPGALH